MTEKQSEFLLDVALSVCLAFPLLLNTLSDVSLFDFTNQHLRAFILADLLFHLNLHSSRWQCLLDTVVYASQTTFH